MDDLKNLMIQTLETNGILGQLRAQIRCSVFKIIDNQDDLENPRLRGKSALHWENQLARECLNPKVRHAQLLAELIREYLDFYRLDYSKQVFLPETNLTTKKESSRDELIEQTGLTEDDTKKPLLLQILEKFKSGATAVKKVVASSSASPNTLPPDMDFSNEKKDLLSGIGNLKMGEGILPPERSPPKQEGPTTADKNIEKANSLLEELSREEKSGFKAEIGDLHSKMEKLSSHKSLTDPLPGSQSGSGSPQQPPTSKKDDDFSEEEIAEDLPMDDPLDGSGDRLPSMAKIGESHGITVSQSLGIDPSVDSLALEDYDHIELVEQIKQ